MSTSQFLEYLHASPATARLAESLAEVVVLRGHPVDTPVEVSSSRVRIAS